MTTLSASLLQLPRQLRPQPELYVRVGHLAGNLERVLLGCLVDILRF